MAVFSAQDQLLLELVNRARLDPSAEAARLGIALNEGLAAGTISATAKDPLAPNSQLHTAAEGHSNHMLAVDMFGHAGIGDGTTESRITGAGYTLAPPYAYGENIAYVASSGALNPTTAAIDNYENLFIDAGIAGRGHRLNILSELFREGGFSQVMGNYTGFNAAMLTQDFGFHGNLFFVTGVAINDNNSNNFYDVGEGRSGISVTLSSGGTVATQAAGGYSAPFVGGNVTVTFSGGGLGTPVNVTIAPGAHNAKVDLAGANEILTSASATLGSGALHLTLLGVANLSANGNASNNVITGNRGNNVINGLGGADTQIGGAGNDTYHYDIVGDVAIEAANGGTDLVRTLVSINNLGANLENVQLNGVGNFLIVGNTLTNVMNGNPGINQLRGMAGNDVLFGFDGADVLIGGAGKDQMAGGNGNDAFHFDALADLGIGATRDFITDFTVGADDLDFNTMDANSVAAGNQNFVWRGTGAFTGAGQLRYIQTGGNTIVQGNLDGNTATIEFEVQLNGLKALTAGDIVA